MVNPIPIPGSPVITCPRSCMNDTHGCGLPLLLVALLVALVPLFSPLWRGWLLWLGLLNWVAYQPTGYLPGRMSECVKRVCTPKSTGCVVYTIYYVVLVKWTRFSVVNTSH